MLRIAHLRQAFGGLRLFSDRMPVGFAGALVVMGLCVGCAAAEMPEAEFELPVVAPEKPETKTPGVMIEIPLDAQNDTASLM